MSDDAAEIPVKKRFAAGQYKHVRVMSSRFIDDRQAPLER